MEDASKIKPSSEVINEFLERTNWPQEKLAKTIGVRQKTISDIKNGKSGATGFLAGIRFTLTALNNGFSKEDLLYYLIEELRDRKQPNSSETLRK